MIDIDGNLHRQNKIMKWLHNELTSSSLKMVIHNETGKIIK